MDLHKLIYSFLFVKLERNKVGYISCSEKRKDLKCDFTFFNFYDYRHKRFNIINGLTTREYYGGNIPFIRSGEIGESSTELYITEEGLKNSSAALVEQGDILYTLYGATSGEVDRSKIKGAINQAILAIIPEAG